MGFMFMKGFSRTWNENWQQKYIQRRISTYV